MDEILEVNIKPMKALPHGRALTLYWDDNSITSIRFDHGFGCWSINGRPAWINLKAKPEVQVEEMYNILRNLKIKFNKQFPTQIFIKKRII